MVDEPAMERRQASPMPDAGLEQTRRERCIRPLIDMDVEAARLQLDRFRQAVALLAQPSFDGFQAFAA
jgi:hypothetical protein